MNWSIVGKLPLLWWNTGLALTLRNEPQSDANMQFVLAQIKAIYERLPFALMGLCEVDGTFLDKILTELAEPNLSVVYPPDNGGLLRFDTALIYDRRWLEFVDRTSSINTYARSNLKIGEFVRFDVPAIQTTLFVVASHWASRQFAHEDAAQRIELAIGVRQGLDEIRRSVAKPYILLMGDYNDDPFSKPLSQHLLATRDRNLAATDERYLYNPFWRRLGESMPLSERDDSEGVFGTYYYSSGQHTKWFTFDQMMFSSAFLNDASIRLDEQHSRVVASAALRSSIRSRKVCCDHFPVYSSAELRIKT